ncbi:MAG TPA: LD-carboxypeptidase [Chitinophagaceae bacterium]|nr:LD-carboxypeptidase [Chitinophagaceae bacterium]
MTKIPPALKPGDTIGITCPSSKISGDVAAYAAEVLKSWGLKVRIGKTVGGAWNNFSAPDADRRSDLQDMLDDPEIQAILFGRGGYGMVRILDGLNFKAFAARPKWIAGYSDITTLHIHIYHNYKIASLHSLMCSGIIPETAGGPFVTSLKNALFGMPAIYTFDSNPLNISGDCIGPLVGGNLSLLANLSGTVSCPNMRGKILLLEDTSEYRYVVDRMMYNLKRAGWLEGLAGMIVGSFTDYRDTSTPFGQTEHELIRELVKEEGFPVCFGFPAGHQVENYALKIGVPYQLKVEDTHCHLREKIS